MSVLVVYIKFF